ncbi:MAG TPA: hypothetical protein VMU48_07155 [Terracidiphilus sp.]|nr:hypothetical protein [Terracidiphilus sp.]
MREISVGAILLAFIVIFALTRLYRTTPGSYFTSNGRVEETRITEIHLPGGEQGGGLNLFRIEARVSYSLDGTMRNRWMAASEPTTARQLLEEKLKTAPKVCIVYWSPKHPENPRCRLK